MNVKIVQNLKKKLTFLTKIPRLNVILYQTTVSFQKIIHILQKKNYHLLILRMKIYKIITTPDINKANGHDEVSIRMLKLCDKNFSKTTLSYSKTVNLKRRFLICGKKQVAPIHKKEKNLSWKIMVQFHSYQFFKIFDI